MSDQELLRASIDVSRRAGELLDIWRQARAAAKSVAERASVARKDRIDMLHQSYAITAEYRRRQHAHLHLADPPRT